jgi:hypothetical protein
VDATKGPKKGKLVNASVSLGKRTKSLLEAALGASEFFCKHMKVEDTPQAAGCRALLYVSIELCRILAVVTSGMPNFGEDSLEQREQRSVDLMRKQGLVQLKLAREILLPLLSIKMVCSLLPNYIVPIFALFRMCDTVCTMYGWGKRKKTKKVSVAMADFALELNGLLQEMLKSIQKCPKSETEPSFDVTLNNNELQVINDDEISSFKHILTRDQYLTRLRIEPILQEMDEMLDEFEHTGAVDTLRSDIID